MDPAFFAVAALAVFIVGLSKAGLAAGMGVAAVPILTLVMDARDAAGMMLPLLLVMDALVIFVYRREMDWRVFWLLIPGAMVGTGIGWALSAVVSEAAVRLLIGLITLLFVLDAWLPLRKRLEGLPPSRPWGAFWGTLAGFTSFISHTGSPPIHIYVLPMRLEPVIFAGTNALIFGVINAAKIVPYHSLGQLSPANMQAALLLLPVCFLGVAVGVVTVRRLPAALFYRITYLAVFLLSLKLIYDGVAGLAGA